MLLVIAGLIYDNGILAIGRFIGEGSLLEGLNLLRYWSHAFLTPLLVIFSWTALKKAGLKWARARTAAVAAALVTLSLVLIELFTEIFGLALEPVMEYGILSYKNAEAGGPPIMVLVVSAVLLIASAIVFWKQHWPWFFVGSALMLLGSGIRLPVESGAVTNLFELILLTSLLVTKAYQDKNPVH